MLDIFDFFGDKGATPEKIRESQRKRYASDEVVDEIIAMAEEAKAGEFSRLTQRRRVGLTEMGQRGTTSPGRARRQTLCRRRLVRRRRCVCVVRRRGRGLMRGDYQAKEDASELLAKKIVLEKEKKELEAIADEKEKEVQATVGTVGNYVHESVPVSNNEVSLGLIESILGAAGLMYV